MKYISGERHDREYPQHVQRHERGPGEAEPGPGQDQQQDRLGHHQGEDGQRESCCFNEVENENQESYSNTIQILMIIKLLL